MQYFRPTCVILLFSTLLLGFIYPLFSTFCLQSIFPKRAHGSLIYIDEVVVGSELIGQYFSDPQYFWGRPFASGASNLAISNPILLETYQKRIEIFKKYASPEIKIPADLITGSASGLDPHISVQSAYYQMPRVAKLRNISQTELKQLIDNLTQNNYLNLFGENVVPVLALNIQLDKMYPQHD